MSQSRSSMENLSDVERSVVGSTKDAGDADASLVRLTLAEQMRSLNTTDNPPQSPPIFSLPFEIIAEIFLLYTEGIYSAHDYRMVSKRGTSTPLLLAAICSAWREIAFTAPRLWTTINILIYSFAKIPLLAELAGRWMARSGNLPLTIGLSISDSIIRFEMPSPHEVSPMFDVIRNVACRWRQLILCIPSNLYDLFIGPLTLAPVLQDLRLIPIFPQESNSGINFCLAEAPQLTHLELSRIYVNKTMIPWHNLTSLDVNFVFAYEMLELLKISEQLISAKFSDICGLGDIIAAMPATPLTHSHLKHLDIRPDYGDMPDALHTFLQNITLPSLESFVYHGKGSFPVDEFLSLFTRSGSPIANLEIVPPDDDPDITEQELIRLLDGIPSLTTLSVSVSAQSLRKVVTDSFISRLYLISDFLPHLEVLNFIGWRGFSWECLADLWVANQTCGLKFRHLNIKLYNEGDDTNLALFYIDKRNLTRLLHPISRNPQTTLSIVDNVTGVDMIAASLAFHGITN